MRYFTLIEKSALSAIDCVKLYMAIMVVAIHTVPFAFLHSQEVNVLLNDITSLAVPFFFIASGFFLWRKIRTSDRVEKLLRIKGWLHRIGRLYLIWTIIYFPFTIWGFYREGIGLKQSILVFIRNFMFVGQNYLSWPLWYLLACFVAGILIFGMVRWQFSYFKMLLIATCLACLGSFLDYSYSLSPSPWLVDCYYKLFFHTRNGIFQGLLYIVLGIGIAQYGVLNSKSILGLIFVISCIFSFYGYKFALFIASWAFFSLIVQLDVKDRQQIKNGNLRLSSTIIYLVHMLWVGILGLFFPKINSLVLFVLVCLFSLCMAMILVPFKEKSWFRNCFM